MTAVITAWGGTGTEPPQVPLSALEHYAYCARQAGLILLEDAFADDAATVRGTLMHQRVAEPGRESRPGLRTLHALPVWNDALGLTGICDVVEIGPAGRIIPVEHKSGRYEPGGPADFQLAGQVLCLEEMFGATIRYGYIWSGADRKRHKVTVDQAARDSVARIAAAVRALLASGRLPGPAPASRCRRCSMSAGCMPRLLDQPRRHARAAASLYAIGENTGDH
jgi:CRISPR-associated exonuclease Cas4